MASKFWCAQNVMRNFEKPHFWGLLRVMSLNPKSVCHKKHLFMSYQNCGLWLSATVYVWFNPTAGQKSQQRPCLWVSMQLSLVLQLVKALVYKSFPCEVFNKCLGTQRDLDSYSAPSTWLIFTGEGEPCVFEDPHFKNLISRLGKSLVHLPPLFLPPW